MTLHTLKLRAKRAWKSWTVNYGLLLVVLGELQRQTDYMASIITNPRYFGVVMSLIGVLVVGLRFKTAKSLEDK